MNRCVRPRSVMLRTVFSPWRKLPLSTKMICVCASGCVACARRSPPPCLLGRTEAAHRVGPSLGRHPLQACLVLVRNRLQHLAQGFVRGNVPTPDAHLAVRAVVSASGAISVDAAMQPAIPAGDALVAAEPATRAVPAAAAAAGAPPCCCRDRVPRALVRIRAHVAHAM